MIRGQLDRLLASPHFRTSKRCQALLRYVVEAYLENQTGRVKERTIGFEVFQREADYDTNQDSVVRTTAAETRKKLAQYYLEPGHEAEVRVALPQGSYLPEFRYAQSAAAAPAAVEEPAPQSLTEAPRPLAEASRPVQDAPQPMAEAPRPVQEVPRRRTRWIGAGLLTFALAAAGYYAYARAHVNELSLFWKPILDDASTAVLCVGQPLRIYMFDGPRTVDLNEKMVGTLTTPPAAPDVRGKTSVSLSELKPAGDRYYSVGDYLASVRLAEFLGQRHKPFQVIGDRNAGYKDLRGRPAVLIGQFNNVWTMGLTGKLRYYIDRDSQSFTYNVFDREHPEKPMLSASRGERRPEEYAIVSRIFDAPTEKTVVSIAGMTFNGTVAAGEFLTSEQYMREAFGKAPGKWYEKNIQVILKIAMVAGATGPPKPVAAYYW